MSGGIHRSDNYLTLSTRNPTISFRVTLDNCSIVDALNLKLILQQQNIRSVLKIVCRLQECVTMNIRFHLKM
ncbi:hypothetical protein V1477_014397 [Vespula maculifrons]|uniref:Uncharacterized protein n=1 Tax=Vespula maculifrons TaxID=7453 RepID=A0ABD2BKX7_VESMC